MQTVGRHQILNIAFYQRKNVLTIAKELLGKLMITQFEEGETIGRIVETEAYNGIQDKASHAYGKRYTSRTATMYQGGGIAYVYLCYGIHHLFNVVTAGADQPYAVLIRGIEPVSGMEIMLNRLNKKVGDYSMGRGPGNLSKAMGITTAHNGISLLQAPLMMADDGFKVAKNNIVATARIGVDYAGEDAKLPYRFYINGNKWVSRPVRNAQ